MALPRQRQRVAIVGSGLAGLASAYLVAHDARQQYAVQVFESVRALHAKRDGIQQQHGGASPALVGGVLRPPSC